VDVHGGRTAPGKTGTTRLQPSWSARGGCAEAQSARIVELRDKVFPANKNDLGGGDYQDIMTGVDAVLAKYPLDPNRMALIGYSYGAKWPALSRARPIASRPSSAVRR